MAQDQDPALANKVCLDSKAFRNKVAREACRVRLVSRSNSAAGKAPWRVL